MSLCPYAYLRVSLSGLLTASDQGSLTTFGELFNVSALDPLLPTLLIATLCLCALLTILYYSLVVAWEVFWASRRSPSPLDPSAEVVLTASLLSPFIPRFDLQLRTQSIRSSSSLLSQSLRHHKSHRTHSYAASSMPKKVNPAILWLAKPGLSIDDNTPIKWWDIHGMSGADLFVCP